MKKGLIVLVLFILCFSTTALALQITYDSIQEEVLPGQSAKYLIHLTNNADEKVTVTIKTVDIIWGMDKDSTRYELNPRETRAIEVTYAPFTEKITPKLYGITFQAVTDTTREIKTLPALVVDYQDTVDASFSSLPTIDPRRSTIVKVLLTNKHNILLEGIKVTLESQFFKEAQTVTLQGKEAQELEFPISLDPETIEGQYTLKTLIDLDNENLLTEEFLYTIGKYSNAKEVIQPEEGILVTGETITQTNEGNAIISETTQRRFGTLSYAFTDFTPAPTTITKTDQGYVASWTYNLQPGETIILQTTTNYRQPLLFALLILAVLALIYYFSKRHIEIIKKVLLSRPRGSARQVFSDFFKRLNVSAERIGNNFSSLVQSGEWSWNLSNVDIFIHRVLKNPELFRNIPVWEYIKPQLTKFGLGHQLFSLLDHFNIEDDERRNVAIAILTKKFSIDIAKRFVEHGFISFDEAVYVYSLHFSEVQDNIHDDSADWFSADEKEFIRILEQRRLHP